jgi:hypothetical protein
MQKQLRKLVIEKGIEKLDKVSDYYQYRIVSELKRIKQLNIEDEILCLERMVSIAKQLNLPLEIEQEPVKSSFVCYLLGITVNDPIEAKLVFTLPDSLGEIRTAQSMETMQLIYNNFTAEDELLFFGELIKYAPKEEPTENR